MPSPSKKSESISLSELAKKIVYASLGSAAMARSVVTDSKLHKDVLNSLLSKAEKRKDELINMLAGEVSKFLGKINVAEEMRKALKGLVINLNASIDFQEKKDKKAHPKGTIHKASVKKNIS